MGSVAGPVAASLAAAYTHRARLASDAERSARAPCPSRLARRRQNTTNAYGRRVDHGTDRRGQREQGRLDADEMGGHLSLVTT